MLEGLELFGVNLSSMIFSIFGVIITFVLGKWGVGWGKALIDLRDAVNLYVHAKKKDSPGGKEITSTEWEKIAKEIGEAAAHFLMAFLGFRNGNDRPNRP